MYRDLPGYPVSKNPDCNILPILLESNKTHTVICPLAQPTSSDMTGRVDKHGQKVYCEWLIGELKMLQ